MECAREAHLFEVTAHWTLSCGKITGGRPSASRVYVGVHKEAQQWQPRTIKTTPKTFWYIELPTGRIPEEPTKAINQAGTSAGQSTAPSAQSTSI